VHGKSVAEDASVLRDFFCGELPFPGRSLKLGSVSYRHSEGAHRAAIVKDPALAGESGLRFVFWQFHRILSPLKTMTGEPSATKAQSGRR